MPSYNITNVEYTENIGEPISMVLCDCECIGVTHWFNCVIQDSSWTCFCFVFSYGPLTFGAFIYIIKKKSCDLASWIMAGRSFSKSGQFIGNFLYSIYVFNYD